MKKLLYCAAALAAVFFAGSCQRENLEPVAGGNTVTYTVQLPDVIGTKVGQDVTAVNELVYEVYRTEATSADDYSLTGKRLFQKTTSMENGRATINFELVNSQNYRVLFWAHVSANGVYTTSDLTNVSLTQTLAGNTENYAAFAGTDYIKDGDALTGRTITLVRPVAQLNIGTSEESLDIEGQTTVKVNTTAVTVNGLSTTFNVSNLQAGAISAADFVYSAAAAPNTWGPLTVNGEPYRYLSMNYLGFAPQSGTTVEVEYTINTDNVGTINNTINNVPVKANYRTNIVGNLITSKTSYIVDLKEEFYDQDGGNMFVENDGVVKNVNGAYEISNANGLAYAINNLFAQGGDFYLTEEIYNLSGYAVNPPAVPAGVTLNIYGETPVVTRAALSGVVITGLDFGALIDQVAATASVSFANITLESDALFVNTNKGAVAFTDCANNDANSDEAAAGLVGHNEGYVADMTAINSMELLQQALAGGVKTIKLNTTIKNTGDVELDLKGATITGVDNNTSGNFYLINNIGKLTIKNTADKAATITLEAKNNRNWNSSSVVVANNPGGNLTIESGVVIEHLGGTDMAYGIDNLTNGKGTSAITTIAGATVKSPYRAVRQFLNGIEATNELYVKAESVLEGANKSIWMQDPSKNANTGKLDVAAGAVLKGDVYLYVTAGSTQWPVSVSIAASALAGESQVITGNLPEGYTVENRGGTWQVITWNTVSTSEELLAALSEGKSVIFANDITVAASEGGYEKAGILQNKAQTIDGNGHTLTVTGAGATWSCAIYTNGGVIKNLTVAGAMRGIFTAGQSSDLHIDNVEFKNVIYTFNSDGTMPANPYGVYVSNSKVNGWTSHSNMHTEVVYTNCSFGEGSGYKYCRPYGTTSFEKCTFCAGYTVDQSMTDKITFKDCIWE